MDVGDRRIGIAVSDALGLTVQGRPTRGRKSLAADLEHIQAMVEESGVGAVVVGHPRHMDGTRSHQTVKTEAFVQHLRSVLTVPVVLWDERLTSFDARERLESMGMGWRKRREHVDELAATLILEDYLGQRT